MAANHRSDDGANDFFAFQFLRPVWVVYPTTGIAPGEAYSLNSMPPGAACQLRMGILTLGTNGAGWEVSEVKLKRL